MAPVAVSKAGPTAADGGATSAFTAPLELSRIQPLKRTKRPFTDADIRRFTEICGCANSSSPAYAAGSETTRKEDWPLAVDVASNVLVYDGPTLQAAARGPAEGRDAAMAELHRALLQGPGVYVVRGCYTDAALVDRVSAAFQKIIEREKASTGGRGDHFAPAGHNDRIWNAFQKHAELDPESFVEYYANDVLALACEAWLGPNYAITAQTNVVRPGGKAQEPHRDYHLGFQDEATAARFPLVSQIASQLLTLQLGVAHTAMPLESGPTLLLPYSQHFDYGFQAYRHGAFHDVFHARCVQLPLARGDAVFFNPALFHAAGENRTADIHRAANLMQVSACWGKPMETVDRAAIVRAVWPAAQRYAARPGAAPSQLDALLTAISDGYSFPTNLDRDPPPPNGHCPPTQRDVVQAALEERADDAALAARLAAHAEKRLA